MKKSIETAVPGWERKTDKVLGFLILLSCFYQMFFGDIRWTILVFTCYALIKFPHMYTKNRIQRFPIEVEILLFLMVILQFILGEIRHFYINIPYYDKIVHYMIPMFLGMIGFLIFYTMYATGKLKTSMGAMMIIIILVSLGIGAFWEILEYSSDVFLYPNIPGWHHFQGNAQQDAITDTMTDLITDFLGGVFGAFIGLWYFRKKVRENLRQVALVAEVNEILDRKMNENNSTKSSKTPYKISHA